ncbi:unnamed protein product, partial [Chrysoparadoxa australica]
MTVTNRGAGEREFAFDDGHFRQVCELIHSRAGIALAPGKKDMVYSRLCRRLGVLGLADFDAYLRRLSRTSDPEWEAFTNALTTNLTAFFREPHHFTWLAEYLADRGAGDRTRVWCAAASTGEEPFSIAMVAAETLGRRAGMLEQVATDVDTAVLARARAGVYDLDRIDELSAERRKRFFQRGIGPNAGKVRVRPETAAAIRFQTLNLVAPEWRLDGVFDVIFCRNVMIYFDKPTQRRILERM